MRQDGPPLRHHAGSLHPNLRTSATGFRRAHTRLQRTLGSGHGRKRRPVCTIAATLGYATVKLRPLEVTYLVIAAAAMVGTWSHIIAFFRESGDVSALAFLRACFVNHAASSIAIDIIAVAAAAFVFMGVEARRLGIRHVWVYMLLSIVIAISVMLPIFLFVRERRRNRVAAVHVSPSASLRSGP